MTVDSIEDLEGLLACGRAVADARDTMLAAVEPGISTLELDHIGAEVLARYGAQSAPQAAYRFPGTTCISVNEEAAHGIPSARVLRDGDLVNIDVSAVLAGYWTDTGASIGVGTIDARDEELLLATRRAQADAMAVARAGNRLSQIGKAVEAVADAYDLSIIENLCGHGVGRFIHEDPQVPSVSTWRDRTKLHEGLVIAIEPFLALGSTYAVEGDDGWTLYTDTGSRVAQYEHTVIVTKDEPIIVTASAA